jgi:hypothetical protein
VGAASFSSGVSFGCLNLPALTSCEFNPATITAGTGTTPVTLTIATTGPNFGMQSQVKGRVVRGGRLGANVSGDESSYAYRNTLPFFALAWAGLVGTFGFGLRRRGKLRLYAGIAVICLGLGSLAEISCGGVVGSGSTAPPVVATVTVNPPLATLFANESGNLWPVSATQQQFTATVNNSTDQTVTWAVTGGSPNGTVDATGLYTAPAVVPNPATATVTATSSAATAPGTTFVNVATPTALGASQITVTAMAVGGTTHGDVVTLTVQ